MTRVISFPSVSLRAYLELLRPANVVTALADVLAGFAIAGLAAPQALPWLLVATACLYAGGVVLNDVCDRGIDAIERPERPIPGGRVRVGNAAFLGTGLLTIGNIAAGQATREAAAVALALTACILLYDAWAKHQAFLGPVGMGGCRAFNLLLGMAAVPGVVAVAWPLGLLPLTYIAAVTALSRGEVRGGKREMAAFALLLLILVLTALLALTIAPTHRSPAGFVLTMALGWRILPPFWRAWQDPGPATIRQAIKTGVLSLVLVDGVLGAAYAGALYSIAILATGLLAAWLARLFSVT
jgi:4-hydroxybenzoate polyprenyltransferase